MKPLKRLPTSINHLATWLRAWTQPSFWIPTAVFCAGGVLIWAVAVNPEWLSLEEEYISDANTSAQNAALSPEDKVIAAEIDTIPVLEDELNRSTASATILNNSVVRTKGLFNELRDRSLDTPKPEAAPNSSFSKTLFAVPDSENPPIPTSANNNPLNFNSVASLTPKTATREFATDYSYPALGTSLSNANIPNSGKSTRNPETVSQLQAVIENYRTTNPEVVKTNPATSSNQPPVTPALSDYQPQFSNPPATSPDLVPGFNPNIPTTTLTPQPPSFPPNNQAQVNPLNNPYQNNPLNNPYQTNLYGSEPVPELQPVAPSAPSATMPGMSSVSPNNFGQSSFLNPIPGTKVIDSGTPNSGNVGFPTGPQAQPNLGVGQSQVNQTWQPLAPSPATSAPRPLPGRYIGGGEINTFANP